LIKKIIYVIQIVLVIYAIHFLGAIDYKEMQSIFGMEQVVSVITLLVFHFIRAERLQGIIRVYSPNFSLIDSIKLYYVSLAFAIVTPGRTGELYRIKLLNENNIKYADAIRIFLIEKYTDATTLLLFLIFSLLIVFIPDFNLYSAFFLSILISLMFIYMVYLSSASISCMMSKDVNKSSTIRSIVNFLSELFKIGYSKIFLLHLKTVFGWFIFLYALWVGISSIHLLSLVDMIGVHILNSVAVSIPISYMGYGIREIFLDAFVFKGVSDDYIVVGITIQYTIFYLISVVAGLSIFIGDKIITRRRI
jgi:hypothetical protein